MAGTANRRKEILSGLDAEIESMSEAVADKGLGGLDYGHMKDIDLLKNARIIIGSVFKDTATTATQGE